MNQNWEQFQAIYQKLDQSSREFIDSDAIPNLAKKIISDYKLTLPSPAPLIITITNYYASILPEYQLPQALVEVGVTDNHAMSVTQMIIKSLPQKPVSQKASIPDKNSGEIHSNNQNTTTTAPQTDPTLVAKQREDLLKEIEKAEEKLASIQPIRTMQTDYQHTTQPNVEPDEHNGATQSESVTRKTAPTDGTIQNDESPVHRTSQDDLLRKKPSAQQYATLTPTQDTAPQWGSDNS